MSNLIGNIYRLKATRSLVLSEERELQYCEECGSPSSPHEKNKFCKACGSLMISRTAHLENLAWWLSIAEAEALQERVGFEHEEAVYPYWPTGLGESSGSLEYVLLPRLNQPLLGIVTGDSTITIVTSDKTTIEDAAVFEYVKENRFSAGIVYWGYFCERFYLYKAFNGSWYDLSRFGGAQELPGGIGHWGIPVGEQADPVFQQEVVFV